MWHALRGTDYTLDIDIHKIAQLSEMFKEAMKDYFIPPEATRVEPLIPFFPMPGGALTANTQMLRDNNLMDKYPQMIAAMGEAVRKGGFGTSVTPVSQFYFQQAFNNVMFGPWKKIADGYGKMVLGYFGKTPVPPAPEVVQAAQEQLKLAPTTDHLAVIEKDTKRGLKAVQAILEKENLEVTDENLFIVASCEDKGVAFLKGHGTLGVRKNKPTPPAATAAPVTTPATPGGATLYGVTINGQNFTVKLEGNTALVNETRYSVNVKEGAELTAPSPVDTSTGTPLLAQLPGLVLRVERGVGTPVKHGEIILVLESMKMETAIASPVTGTVSSIQVKQGDQVQAGALLAIIQ
jgi:pyruvate carboxylase subunit B